ITSAFTTLDGSTTANGAGTSSTTLILTSATNFDIGNYVKVSSTDCVNGVNVCYAKITNIATNTLTISPAITWANLSAVVEVHVPEVGGTNTASTLDNRYGRGYFIDGIVAGNGSTYYTDNKITFGGGSQILDTAGKLQLQAGGATAGDGGNGSIYFNDSSGTTTARFDTQTTVAGVNSEGALSVASGTTTINSVATTQLSTSTSTGTTVRVVSTTGIVANDLILIMIMKGGTPGDYDLLKVVSVDSSTQLTVSATLSSTYSQTTNSACGTSDTNCAQVVRIPRYTTITCTDGTITAAAWSTTTGVGGILWAEATGDVSISSTCTVDMNGKGYNGGTTTSGGIGGAAGGTGGGSSAGATGGGPSGGGGGGSGGNPGTGGPSNPSGGGGAGGAPGGGGGGGYNGVGTAGTGGTSGTGGNGGNNGGAGSGGGGGAGSAGSAGSSISPTFTSRILMGGGAGAGGGGAGGGGGGTGGNNASGGAGGNGGAGGAGGGVIVFHSATSITNSATVRTSGANGSNGTNGTAGTGGSSSGSGGGGAPGAGGGAGAGGSIWLNAPSVTAGTLTTSAGSAGTAGTTGGAGGATGGCGSGGGAASAGAGGGGEAWCGAPTAASGGSAGAGGAGATGRTDSSTNNSLVATQTYGTLYLGATNTSSADVAEYYQSADSSIGPKDIVSWGTDSGGNFSLLKTQTPYQATTIGVISTNPGIILGSRDGADNTSKRLLALSGTVPVKVTSENGPIAPGDYITSSSIPGVGMRACGLAAPPPFLEGEESQTQSTYQCKAGRVVGIALESYSSEDPTAVTSIMLFLNPHWLGNDLSVQEQTGPPTPEAPDGQSQLVNLDPEALRIALATLGLAIDVDGALTVTNVKTQNLTVGSEAKPSGITLYDRNTGTPYCVGIENGEWTRIPGLCIPGAQISAPADSSTASTTTSSATDTSTTTGTIDTTTVIDSTIPTETTSDTTTSSDTTTTTELAPPAQSPEGIEASPPQSSEPATTSSDTDPTTTPLPAPTEPVLVELVPEPASEPTFP
ncbi:MAG: hypothetical protein Q7J73_03490, partial [Dehalococcoidales bacterium]|nr:hypothetical protein [Dehalococcoidales bacterium]